MSEDLKIGQIFIRENHATIQQVAHALKLQIEQRVRGEARILKLGEILLFLGIIDLPKLHNALRAQKEKAKNSRQHAVQAKQKAVEVKLRGLHAELNQRKEKVSPLAFMYKLFGSRRS